MLARKSLFGEDIMKQCTPGGSKDLPALPLAELLELKSIVFAISQAGNALRSLS